MFPVFQRVCVCAQVVKRVGSLQSLPRPTNTRDIFTHTRDQSSAQRAGLAECAQARFRWSACIFTLDSLKTDRRIYTFLYLSNRSLFYLCRKLTCFVETVLGVSVRTDIVRFLQLLRTATPMVRNLPANRKVTLKLETKTHEVQESRGSKYFSYLKKERKSTSSWYYNDYLLRIIAFNANA